VDLVTLSTVRPSSGLAADDLADIDRRHVLHPHQRGARHERRLMVRGSRSTVWDAAGREFLDALGGGIWVAQVGHGRAELAAAAAQQMTELAHFTSFFEYGNDKSAQLAQRLVELAPDGITRVFFTCGGSEGVDTAMKLARLYHHHRGETDRNWIIARHFGYHGSTYGGGTATGIPGMEIGIGPMLPHVEKVMPPYVYHTEMYGGRDATDFLIDELAATIDRLGAGTIAAMIGEPIMGGGGVIAPPDDYWPRVRTLLNKHGILLIADEVITAYGRAGHWFESAPRGMSPDLIVTAKGITSGYVPLGAVLMRDEIAETVAGTDRYLFHGYTYSGHPTACAVALANLDILAEEGLLERAVAIGERFRRGLAPAGDLPTVGDVRVHCAMVGVELVSDKAARVPIDMDVALAVADELYEAYGVITRNYGPTLVLSPPLVFTDEETDRTSGAVVEVLSRLDPAKGTFAAR